MAKPTVILDCVADRHSAGDERIVEVSSGFGGCLIALTERDGRLIVDVYRTDPTVTVRTDRDTGARKCCDCGRDLTDAMGVYVFASADGCGTRPVPGLLRCVDCHIQPHGAARRPRYAFDPSRTRTGHEGESHDAQEPA